MLNQAWLRTSVRDGGKLLLHHQVLRYAFTHRIANDFAAVQILQTGKI